MAGGITVNAPNREINQEDHRENHSSATSSGNLLGQKRDAAYVVDTEQSSWKRHARPKKSVQEEAQRLNHHEPSIIRPCQGKFNPTLCCDFHKKNGHATSECRQLQDILLSKYQQGEGKTNLPPYCTFHKSKAHDTSKCKQLQEALLKKYQRGETQNINPSTFLPRSRLQPGTDRAVRSAHLASSNSGPSQQNNQVSDRYKASTSARFKSSQDRHSIHIFLGEPNSDKDPVRTVEYHRESENTASSDLPHDDSFVITLAADSRDITKIQIDSCDVTKIQFDTERTVDFSCQTL